MPSHLTLVQSPGGMLCKEWTNPVNCHLTSTHRQNIMLFKMVFRFIDVHFACRCLWGSEESIKFPWVWSYSGELLCECWEWNLFPLIHIPSPSFKSLMGIIILNTSWDYCNAQRGQPAVMISTTEGHESYTAGLLKQKRTWMNGRVWEPTDLFPCWWNK